MFDGMPDWKRKLIREKMAAKSAKEAIDRELDRQKYQKLSSIASMPEWKRKLFLEKNPQYGYKA